MLQDPLQMHASPAVQSSPTDSIEGRLRWEAVLAHDAAHDGKFVYAVKTTGVYCRPSCAARRPRPENVVFFTTRDGAERAGYRPCKRCRPERLEAAKHHVQLVAELCRLIEQSDETPRLDELAAHAGLSPFHLHRVFKQVTGVTPRAYAAAKLQQRVREQLKTSDTVTQAIYGAGYNSSGRFYEQTNSALGMTPSEFRSGGKDLSIAFTFARCSLGRVLVATTERGVCAILLGDSNDELLEDLKQRFPRARLYRDDGSRDLLSRVIVLLEDPAADCDLPLDIRGTAFQQRVWRALSKIPPGSTATYTDIARAVGAPSAARAVGSACAKNPLAVAVPCHRVLRGDGDLAGYRWGKRRKTELLARESRRKQDGS